MQRYRILHRTYYNFSGLVQLAPHQLRLRPREGHELRIESSRLEITPEATVRWHRDVEGNSVGTAIFNTAASQLVVESEVVIQQYNQAPLDFLMADYAMNYPFDYRPEERILLTPYLERTQSSDRKTLSEWIGRVWRIGDPIQTYVLVERLSAQIFGTLAYQAREEPGVQSFEDTLSRGTGSCRDFASL